MTRRIAKISRISQQAWLIGILSSLLSSGASLVKLRADSRRYMLSREVARREAASPGSGSSGEAEEKTREDRVREEEERRERGRALLSYVFAHLRYDSGGSRDRTGEYI